MGLRSGRYIRAGRLAAACLVAALCAQAPAQSEAPPPDATEYETIRISKPDGTVVVLRVPTGKTPERPRSGGADGRPGPARAGTAEQREPSPAARGPHGVRMSHPTRGVITLQASVPLERLIGPVGIQSRVSAAATVAGDDPSTWRSGRAWAPSNESDDRGDYLSSDPEAIQVLAAGVEFVGEWPPPGPIGEPEDPGYDAEVIAQWDVVPHQTVAGDFEIGLLAFHMNGIERVEIAVEGGPRTVLTEMQVNPRTGVRQYVARLAGDDANLRSDEHIEVRAIAYPAGPGTPRLLDPLYLYINPQGSYTGPTVYVAAGGNDTTGNGSRGRPYATIKRALNACNTDIDLYEGARIVLAAPGRYDIDQPSAPVRNTRWITIEADPTLDRDEVVIASGSTSDLIRPNTQRLRFHRVSLDFADMYQMYKEDPHQQWYDNCKWTYGPGWTYTPPSSISPVRNVGYGGLFVTDSLSEDSIYAFINCNLVRNSHAERISGDVFQNSLMVVQCTASMVDGTVLPHHSDLLQYFGNFENLIVYNVSAAFVKHTQNIFLDHANSSFTNCAFVNIAIQNAESDPPFCQLNSAHDHVLFQHLSNPGQRFVMRDDFPDHRKFVAQNVFFRNCVVERLQAADYFGPIPQGVHIEHCHFNYNEPEGEHPTTGAIFVQMGPDGGFEHIGYGARKIGGTARHIPGFSTTDTPDRGAAPWGTPR